MKPLIYTSLLVYTSLFASLTHGQNNGKSRTNDVVITLPALFGSGPNTRVIVLPDPRSSRTSSSIRWSGEAQGPVAVDNQVSRRRQPVNTLRVQDRPNVNPVAEPFIPQSPRQPTVESNPRQGETRPQEPSQLNTGYQIYNQNQRQAGNRQTQPPNANQQNQNQPKQETNRQNERQTTNRQNGAPESVRGSGNTGVSPPANNPTERSPKDSIFFNAESPTGGSAGTYPPINRQQGNNQQKKLGSPTGVRNRPNFVPAASLFVPTENRGASNSPTNRDSNQTPKRQITSPGSNNNNDRSLPPPGGASPNPNLPNKIQYIGNVKVGSVPAVNPDLLAGNAPVGRTTDNQSQQNNAFQGNGVSGNVAPQQNQITTTPSMSEIDIWIRANLQELMNRYPGMPASPGMRNIRTRIDTITAGQEVNPGPPAPKTAAQTPPPTGQNVPQSVVPQNNVPSSSAGGTDNTRTNAQQQVIPRGNQQQTNSLPKSTQLGNNPPVNREMPAVKTPPVNRKTSAVNTPPANNADIQRRPPTNFIQPQTNSPNIQTELIPNVNQFQGRANRPVGPSENTANQGPNLREGGLRGNQNTLRNSNQPQVQNFPQRRGQFRPDIMLGGAQNLNNEGNLGRNTVFNNLGPNAAVNRGFQQSPPSPADGTLPSQFRLSTDNTNRFNPQWQARNPNTGMNPLLRPNPGTQMNPDIFNLLNRLPGSQNVPPRNFPVLPGVRGGMILPNPALMNNLPPTTPEPTEAPEVEAGVVEVEATPNINPALQNWPGVLGNPIQNPNTMGVNGPLGPNGARNAPNSLGRNWFDQLPRLPGWSNRQIDPFQQQPVNPLQPPPNSPFQQQAPPNLSNPNNAKQTPPRPQLPNGRTRIPVNPNQQAGPEQRVLGNQMRPRTNSPNPPPQQPRNQNAQIQPAWKPPRVQPQPTNPPPRQTHSQVTPTPSPKPVQKAWRPPVNQGPRNNVNQLYAPVGGNQQTANQGTSGLNVSGLQRPGNMPGQQPAVDNPNPATRQPAWQPTAPGQPQQGGNTNPALSGQPQTRNGMSLFPNGNRPGNGQGATDPRFAGMPPHLANMAMHRRLLDQACGPSKLAQQNYQRQYMAFLAGQQRQRQAQMAMFQRQAEAAAQNPMFQQGTSAAAPNPLFPQRPAGATGQTANTPVRRKRQAPFFNMPGMSPTSPMQQMQGRPPMQGMAQFPGMPPMQGMPQMAGMMPMVAPESPEINYQCTVSESCGMTTQERSQTIHRSQQSVRDCQSTKTGLLCCLG